MMGIGDEFDPSDVAANEPRKHYYEEVVDRDGIQKAQEVQEEVERLETLRDRFSPSYNSDAIENYQKAVETIDGEEFYPESLYALCEAEMDAGAGFLLSAAIHASDGEYFLLPDLAGVDYVGMLTEKTVRVEGSVGDYAGYGMEEGKLIVEGSAGDYLGHSTVDSTIDVDGVAGSYLGKDMESGTVYVDGCDDISFWIGDAEVFDQDDEVLYPKRRHSAIETVKPQMREYRERDEGVIEGMKDEMVYALDSELGGGAARGVTEGSALAVSLPSMFLEACTGNTGNTAAEKLLQESSGTADRSHEVGMVSGFLGTVGVGGGSAVQSARKDESPAADASLGALVAASAANLGLDVADGMERKFRSYIREE